MPELALYRNPEIQYAPRVNLQVADNVLSTMQQNHLKTIELQGELAAAVNEMDLDESENGYKAGLIDDIERTVEDSTVNGYSGYALDDIVKKYGDIKKNPVLIGKIKANQAHKANDAKLDQMVAKGTITQDTADRFKYLNPYYNNVQLDKNGNAIGTDTWEAKYNPVRDIPVTEIFNYMSSILQDDKSAWDTITYVGADGSEHSTYQPGDVYIKNSSGTKQYLTEDKIRAAWDATLRANPEYAAALKQAKDNQEWHLNTLKDYKEDDIASGMYSAITKNGVMKSDEQYLKDILDPFIKVKRHNWVTSVNNSMSPIKPTKSSGNSSSLSGFGDLTPDDIIKLGGTESYLVQRDINREEINTSSDSQIRGFSLANEMAKKYNLPNINPGSLGFLYGEDLINAITDATQGPLTPEQQIELEADAARIRGEYKEYGSYLDDAARAINNKNATGQQSYNAIVAGLRSGQDPSAWADSENPHLKNFSRRFGRHINSGFGYNYDKLYFRSKSAADIGNIITNLGFGNNPTNEELLSKGITISDNGKSISIDKSYQAEIIPFLENTINMDGAFSLRLGDNPYVNYSKKAATTLLTRLKNDIEDVGTSDVIDKTVNPSLSTAYGSATLPAVTADDYLNRQMYAATGKAEYHNMSKAAGEATVNNILHGKYPLNSLFVEAGDDPTLKGIMRDAITVYGDDASTENVKIQSLLQQAIDNNKFDYTKNISMVTDETGDCGIQIMIPTNVSEETTTTNKDTKRKEKENKYKTIRIYYNVAGDPTFDARNNSSINRAKKDIITSINTNPGLNIDLGGDGIMNFGVKYFGTYGGGNNTPVYILTLNGQDTNLDISFDDLAAWISMNKGLSESSYLAVKDKHQKFTENLNNNKGTREELEQLSEEQTIQNVVDYLKAVLNVDVDKFRNVYYKYSGYSNIDDYIRNYLFN